ncbi:Vacuolar protein-sorting-associated protein 36 [Smittium culicis]|uniref:Vacuolar protein-sorting-associated protein 36 n=1 Tax=Smittium culicis TaxID=133412 RepID=A0A1R1XGF6_9FUNG|nr:Vacuolar protein-sorting-associated protein 36 [Smittium culicis]
MQRCELGYTLRPLLNDGETVVLISELVTLSSNKDERREGIVYLTNERVVFVDRADPASFSAYIKLSRIRNANEEANYFWSKTKIVIHVSKDVIQEGGEVESNSSSNHNYKSIMNKSQADNDINSDLTKINSKMLSTITNFEWVCKICEKTNISSSNSLDIIKCSLCGVPSKDASSLIINELIEKNACPACTFLNHIDMINCEICLTPLTIKSSNIKYAAISTNESSSTNKNEPKSIPLSNVNFNPALKCGPETFWLDGTDFVVLRFLKSGISQFSSSLTEQLNKCVSKKINSELVNDTTPSYQQSIQKREIGGIGRTTVTYP